MSIVGVVEPLMISLGDRVADSIVYEVRQGEAPVSNSSISEAD